MVGFADDNDAQLKERLRKMTDEQLIRFGKAARNMCSPKTNQGKPPRPEFVKQLEAAREEYLRRKHAAFLIATLLR
jgi:hypothetical protein